MPCEELTESEPEGRQSLTDPDDWPAADLRPDTATPLHISCQPMGGADGSQDRKQQSSLQAVYRERHILPLFHQLK